MPSGNEDEPHVPLHELSHAARTACLLIAFAVTVLGFVFTVPYGGHAYNAAGFGPALVLVLFAMRGRPRRWLLALALLPALGLGLSLLTAIWTVKRFGIDLAPGLFIPSVVTSLITALVLATVERRSTRR